MKSTKIVQDPKVANKAVLYLRYSSESQTENSIEGQRRECMAFAKMKDITVLGEYVDRAISGTTDKRPDFQRMVRDSEGGLFGNVIVWKRDRFSRDMFDALKYERALAENGVKVLSATEANLDTPEGTFMKSCNLGYNQFYSEELSVKVKRGQRENVINGRTLGGYLPLGYKVVDGKYQIDENEGPIIQEAFRLYGNQDYSIQGIQKKFEKEGRRRNDGRIISHSCLEKALKSEKYIGVLKCEGQRNEHAIPALVSKELFEACQKKRNKRKHKNFKLKGKEEYYLSGKVFCKECGSQYLGESGTSHTGKFYTYYKCNGAKHHKCKARPIKKDVLEGVVLSILLALLADDETGKIIAEYVYAQQKNEAPEIVLMRKRRVEVEKQIGNFSKAIGMGIITETTKSSLLALESERSQLDEAIAQATLGSRKFSKEEIRFAIRELSASDITTAKAKSSLLSTFVKRVEIDGKGNISIEFDLFGYSPVISMTSDEFQKVRINTPLLRHRKINTEKSVFFLSIFHLLKGMIALTHIFIKS